LAAAGLSARGEALSMSAATSNKKCHCRSE